MRRQSRAVCVAFVLVSLASACSPASKVRRPLSDAQRAVIAAYSSGVISREGPIRVVFNDPVVAPGALHTPLTPPPLALDPKVAGVVVWSAPNQLEFRSAERLPDGRSFSARVELAALFPSRPGLSAFEFGFASMKQSYEVSVDGLEAAAPTDAKTQRLTGKLVTADVEDAATVEKLVRAVHRSTSLPLEWTHEPDRRTHGFVVTGIVRAEEPSTLKLSWDGTPLGISKSEAREIAVPGSNTFAVDQARAVQEKEQYVELRFTDPLRSPQNLQGLISVGDRDDLRFTIAGSIVRIYSAKSFRGQQTLRVASGIRNAANHRLREGRELAVSFEELKPRVRFVGKGVIVPTSAALKVPIEAVNLRAVLVEAVRVPEGMLPQFLQVNDLGGDRELNRVGRVVWRQTVPLGLTADKENRWVPFGLDLTPLATRNPGGLYRISLSFKRRHVLWSCADGGAGDAGDAATPAWDAEQEPSYWDAWPEGEEDWDYGGFADRHDPCSTGYYRPYYDHNIKVGRNVLVSDIGLIAKSGEDDSVVVVATDLRTTSPIAGAEVSLRDYQQQPLATARTDADGVARLTAERKPFLAVVKHRTQAGYLRLDDGAALSLAHFDVAGVRAPKGLKGFLYGERGVWRPGDTLHLTFVLFDPSGRVPRNHPARFELINSRGQVVQTLSRSESLDGFYTFACATSPDAPTGNYIGRVSVGGATFERVLKVESIMPNRLKIAMSFGADLLEGGAPLRGTLSASWLHGAVAKGLKAEVELALQAAPTRFERFADYAFDDLTAKYETERRTIFEGLLDPKGTAGVDAGVETEKSAPGKLVANLTTRVYEPSGAFSVDRFSIPYSPYARYIGVRAPAGDRARGMLLTDVKHQLSVVAVDPQGRPAGDAEVELKLYKVDWRWWWQRGEEDLSVYAESNVHTPLSQGVVRLKDGVGVWPFEVKYPDWGRYLITASDRQGGHRTAKLLYIDWPGWAGRTQKEGGGGASILAIAPDKLEYGVGETVTLAIPTPQKGRVLVSLESGSRVLRSDWLEATGTETRHTFRAGPEMAPNVYAHVTLLQPHAQSANDLPIRMYGVSLIKVTNPETRLKPVLESSDVFAPEASAAVKVREASGRPMTYTLAVVDEGLLSLTRHATPNPWDHFYAREALAVKTWDVYDAVVGAYGGVLERMLAIGGDEEGARASGKRANRFPPMVRFLGPFRLERGQAVSHSIDVPQYVGAVRVMVVAGRDGAFGAAEKSVFVRKPLMILATLPRVLGPEETVALPVSVFALEPTVKHAVLEASASGPLEVVAPAAKELRFKATGDELVSFKVRTKAGLGVGRVVVRASAGAERAEQTIELDVRTSSVRTVDVLGATLEPGKSWQPAITLPGMAGTNEAVLEVSRIPPLDLGRRLPYLMQYPHGCLEQTISAVFPQLYLTQLLELSPEQQRRIETHVKAGLEKLRHFQTSEGGFGYWPGHVNVDDWSSSYAGHFVLEAQKAGYVVPAGLLEQWKSLQRRRARAWAPAKGSADLVQAYRLYTLALAGAAELGAMNQLRERPELSAAAKWRLAAAYMLAGQPEAARALAARATLAIPAYRELAFTYGSGLRDKAMLLESLVTLNLAEHVGPLAKEISEALSRNDWLSTHETAYSLLALARTLGGVKPQAPVSFSYTWNGGAPVQVQSTTPLVQRSLATGAKAGAVLSVRNTGAGVIYPRLLLSGLPALGQETAASNGLKLDVAYLSTDGKPIDVGTLEQGTNFKARVTLTNTGARGDVHEIAVSQLVAAGWEIHNERLGAAAARTASLDHQDIRDDRVYTYLDLRSGESKTLEVMLNASYLGRFYLPLLSAEAMYDAAIAARVKGQWVQVVEPGTP
jgi:uncharacterized protein YfaS (alpha-2-macroglobulin family)